MKMAESSQNTVEKGEITHDEHRVFKRLVLQTRKNQGLFGKGLLTKRKEAFENIVGKGENTDNSLCLSFLGKGSVSLNP